MRSTFGSNSEDLSALGDIAPYLSTAEEVIGGTITSRSVGMRQGETQVQRAAGGMQDPPDSPPPR